jgi:uncharacterized membrane protein
MVVFLLAVSLSDDIWVFIRSSLAVMKVYMGCWIFWSTAAFSASGAGYFGAKLHCIKRGRATLLCAALKLKQ